MNISTAGWIVVVLAISVVPEAAGGTIEGRAAVWHPLALTFTGPEARGADTAPNPFFDLRLQVAFVGPSGRNYMVAGFFDGDGQGGDAGHVWRARFTPDQSGTWTYNATFRRGPGVAVDLRPDAGEPVDLPGLSGTFEVARRDPVAPRFLKWGRLRYNGGHYLKFADGPYWIRGGTDEPEDFLGYAGFDHTPPKHRYVDHASAWETGDPDWGNGRGRAIIGAVNDLASRHVNSLYALTMNVGGDGRDVWPWAGPINPRGSRANDPLHFHFDLAKLAQWEIVFAHAQRRGIFLHLVLNEAEEANKRELDQGELGPARKLYYRELVARFGHHLALEWNLCEEYNLNFNFGPDRLRAFADYIRALDAYDHPITVHSAGNPVEALRFTYGDPRFAMTSIQLNQRPIHEVAEAIWRATESAGRPLPVSLDEFTLDRGQRASHIPVDDAEGHRREKIWPAYLSGGMLEFILDDLLQTDNFKTPQREALWRYLWYARRFMETELPFWEMAPDDRLCEGGATIDVGVGQGRKLALGPQVFAKTGEVYAVYLPVGGRGVSLDLGRLQGRATQRWYNPRTGRFAGATATLEGGAKRALGPPPADADQDWVALVRRIDDRRPAPLDTTGFNDGAHHWRRIRDDTRFIQAQPDQSVHGPAQVREIAANLLLFQRENGGWPKDYDMLAVLTNEQEAALCDTRGRNDTSFDNHNIHSQVDYLARAYTAPGGGDLAWRDACQRGFDFMLAAQLPNGGFPQRYPRPTGYAAHVTFNDGVMIGILNVLKDAADGATHWKWLDDDRREQARRAVVAGTACILKCQIRVNGQRTGWCQQHDPQTFESSSARTFELASCCPQDTTEIVEFLMRDPEPSTEVRAAIEAAVAWLRRVKITGVEVQRMPAPPEEFLRHKADFDVVVVDDPGAQPIWARHYEIGTDRPVFAGRDAVKRYRLAEIERERRTGTAWYGRWPRRLLDRDYDSWRRRLPTAPSSAPG